MNTQTKELRSREVPFISNEGKPIIALQTGRNDPCRCGSGKKAKNCHGNKTIYFHKKEKA